MSKYGTFSRKNGLLRVRVPLNTAIGARHVHFKLNPELPDERVRAWIRKWCQLTEKRVFSESEFQQLRGRGPKNLASREQPLPEGLKEIVPISVAGVYVIQANGYYVKIGRAQNIRDRIRGMQTASPVPLRLLAIASHNPNDERAIHQRLKTSRVRGEWFHLDEQVVSFIREVSA